MGNWNNLKESVKSVIKQNGNQEITGQVMQSVLVSIINNLGASYSCRGVAKPSTTPGTPDGNVYYFACEEGTYTNFGGIQITSSEIHLLFWNGSTWEDYDTNIGTSIPESTINPIIEKWLQDHPEAITSVQDGSITKAKLATDVNNILSSLTQSVQNINNALPNKQNKLTAGDNITIEGNVISASGRDKFILHSSSAYISGESSNYYIIHAIGDSAFINGHEAMVALGNNMSKKTFTYTDSVFTFQDEDYVYVSKSLFNTYSHVELYIETFPRSIKYLAEFNVVSGGTPNKTFAKVKAGDSVPVSIECEDGKEVYKWTWIGAEGKLYEHNHKTNPPMPSHDTSFNIYTRSASYYECIILEYSNIVYARIATSGGEDESYTTFPSFTQVSPGTRITEIRFEIEDSTNPITSVLIKDEGGSTTLYNCPVTYIESDGEYSVDVSQGVYVSNGNVSIVPVFQNSSSDSGSSSGGSSSGGSTDSGSTEDWGTFQFGVRMADLITQITIKQDGKTKVFTRSDITDSNSYIYVNIDKTKDVSISVVTSDGSTVRDWATSGKWSVVASNTNNVYLTSTFLSSYSSMSIYPNW